LEKSRFAYIWVHARFSALIGFSKEIRDLKRFKAADLFCGGGGTSTAIIEVAADEAGALREPSALSVLGLRVLSWAFLLFGPPQSTVYPAEVFISVLNTEEERW
jgi:hypothetical protein